MHAFIWFSTFLFSLPEIERLPNANFMSSIVIVRINDEYVMHPRYVRYLKPLHEMMYYLRCPIRSLVETPGLRGPLARCATVPSYLLYLHSKLSLAKARF
jgi:hypothetical protein